MTPARRRLPIVAVFSLLPLGRFLFDVTRGFEAILHDRLVDDAFYYYEISKHIPTFNEGIPTSGFHPLLAFLVAPLHRYLGNEPAILGSLALLVIAYSAGAWLVWRYVARYFGATAGLAAAGAWSASGQLYSMVATGVETILAVLLVLAAMNALPDLRDRTPTARTHAPFALLFALAFLARLDAPLLLAPFAAYIGLPLLAQKRWRLAFMMLLIPLSVAVLWLATIYAWTAEIVPGSGAAMRVLWVPAETGLIADPQHILRGLRALLNRTIGLLVSVRAASLAGNILIGAAVGLPVLLGLRRLLTRREAARRLLTRRQRAALRQMALIVAGLSLWSSYYLFYQGGFRLWYFTYLALPAFCILAPLAVLGVKSLFSGKVASYILVAATLFTVGFLSRPHAAAPQEVDKYKSALALDAVLTELPPTARIGSFNSGIYNYVSRYDIVNLDGVVNPRARRAIERDALPQYMAENNIHFLIEHEQALADRRRFLNGRVRLEKVVDFRDFYAPYEGRYARATFLWRVHYLEAR